MISYKRFFLISIFCSLLVVVTFLSSQMIMLLPTAIITASLVLIKSDEERLMYLFFFAPFANVLKLSTGMSSFFILFEIVYVFFSIVRKNAVPFKLTVTVLSVIVYEFIIAIPNEAFPITMLIKLFLWAFIVYFSVYDTTEDTFKNYTLSFATGFLTSAAIGNFSDYYPRIYDYTVPSGVFGEGTVVATRFAGLWQDSNAFAVMCLVALICLLAIYTRKQISSGLYYVLTVLIIIFSFQCYSKMFFIALAGIIMFLFYGIIKRNGMTGIVTGAILFILGMYFVSKYAMPYIEVYLFRFSEATDFEALTTNRSESWITYITTMWQDMSWIFGNGLGKYSIEGFLVPHNSIIYSIYLNGVVGTIMIIYMYAVAFKQCKRKSKIDLLSIATVGILLIGILSIDLNLYDFFTFIIILTVLVSKTGRRIENEKSR